MSDPSTPIVRAFFARAFADFVARLIQGAEVLDRVEARSLAQLREAPEGAWIPFEAHADLLRALWEVTGDVGFKASYRRFIYEAVEHPVLRPRFEATLASFGRDPKTLFRLLPRAVSAGTRGVARPVVRAAGASGCEVWIEWHDVCRAGRAVAWAAMQEATCLAVLDLCHATLDVLSLDVSRLAEGRVDVSVRWQPNRPTPAPTWGLEGG